MREGSKLVAGGGRPVNLTRGHFIEPTVLDRVQHGFWKYHDPEHRQYVPGNTFENVIQDYYATKYRLRPDEFPRATMADRLTLALPLFGCFPGRRLKKIGDLPAGAIAQSRRV